MCALECPEYFAEMRELGRVNGWDTYEVRVVRRRCMVELDDDRRPLTTPEVLAGPVRVRGVYLPRIHKRVRRWLARQGWRLTSSWDWDGDDWLYWADVARLTGWADHARAALIGRYFPAIGRRHRNTAEPSGELSVGDIVAVGEVPLAVGRYGWTLVNGGLNEVRTHEHGTHPLSSRPRD